MQKRMQQSITPGVYEENLIIKSPKKLVALLKDPRKEELSSCKDSSEPTIRIQKHLM